MSEQSEDYEALSRNLREEIDSVQKKLKQTEEERDKAYKILNEALTGETPKYKQLKSAYEELQEQLIQAEIKYLRMEREVYAAFKDLHIRKAGRQQPVVTTESSASPVQPEAGQSTSQQPEADQSGPEQPEADHSNPVQSKADQSGPEQPEAGQSNPEQPNLIP